MERLSYRVVEVFEITGRGVVAVFDEEIELTGGRPLQVRITSPDGAYFDALAFVERLLRRVPTVVEKSALLIQQVPKNALPVGSTLTLR